MKMIKQTKLVTVLSLGLVGLTLAAPQKPANGLSEKPAQNVKAKLNTRGYMGIAMMPKLGAVIIGQVMPQSPADKAGLIPNDEINWIDGIDLSTKNSDDEAAMTFVRDFTKTKKAGEKLTLKILREGQKLTKTIELADYDRSMKQLFSDNKALPYSPQDLEPLNLESLRGVEIIPAPLGENGGKNGGNKAIDLNELLVLQLAKQKIVIEDQQYQLEVKKFENALLKNQMLLLEVKDMLNKQEDQAPLIEINKLLREQNAKIKLSSNQFKKSLNLRRK